GHPPPRLLRADGSRQVLTGERRVPLGIIAGTAYPEAEISLLPGDQVVLHTDGVTEAKNAEGEQFGEQRMDGALAPSAAGARTSIGKILEALEAFTGKAPPLDDYTLLALKFVQSKKKAGEISGEWRAVGR